MNPPNLFQIATRELSQDAFVTWLLQWADPKYQELNSKLFACAQSFIRLLIAEDSNFPIKSVTAGRQWENIDIWAEINDEILLVVEDKTHTGEHSSQLEKYKATAEAWCKDPERGKPWQAKLAYLKTGDEAGGFLQEIRTKGYCTVDRRDFLHLLQSHKDVENDIYFEPLLTWYFRLILQPTVEPFPLAVIPSGKRFCLKICRIFFHASKISAKISENIVFYVLVRL